MLSRYTRPPNIEVSQLTICSKTHNEIWTSMLKKGKSSAGAVQGTVSSTTAHGVLPQYSGHATLALTPTIANKTSLPRAHNSKAVEVESRAIEGENRPPRNDCPPNVRPST